MNTITVAETTAVQATSDAAAQDAARQAQAVLGQAQATAQTDEAVPPDAQAPAAELRFIVLSRLRLSKRNVRKTAVPLDALADSIERVGLLQNLIVVPHPDGESFEVVAGGRRWAALRLLAKKKRIAREQTIPCLVVPDDSAVTVSLTENVQRQDMHPADQFEAFLALVNEGRPIEDIAADFGVTPLVVQRRLKLARISPRLMAEYRQGGVTLEQLMVLTLSDDHTAQEAAYFEAPTYEREPYALRRRLTHGDVDAARSPLARFVGVDAYTAAGGGIRRDLFAQDGEGVTLTDADLLARLAADKLEAIAAEVRAEGWKWVEAVAAFGYSELAAFRRAPQVEREPTAKQAKRLATLQARQEAIEEALQAAEETEDEDAAAKLYEEGDRVGEALDALYAGLLAYAPETMAASGAIVTLDHGGEVAVHRGLLRPEDAKAIAQAAHAEHIGSNESDGDSQNGRAEAAPAKTLSERLVRNLSAHRTAALQAELAKKPDVALAALVHRLALTVFYHGGDSLLQIAVHPQDGLTQHAPELTEGKAAAEFDALRTAWRERLGELSGFTKVFANLETIVVLLLAWFVVILSFFVLSIQLFVTLIEFKLTTLAGFVLVPFALWGKTAFLAEKVLGNVISAGIKVLVLAVIVGISTLVFNDFRTGIGPEPTLDQAAAVMLASLAMLGLGIFGPGIATGLVSGAPQLGAGAVAATGLGAAGVAAAGAAAGGAAVGGAARMAGGGVRAATSMASGARKAYVEGASFSGESGWKAAAAGFKDVARAGASVAGKHLKAGLGRAPGAAGASGAAAASNSAPSAPPAWAKRAQARQQATQGATMAAHAVRSGDSGGGGLIPSLRDDS